MNTAIDFTHEAGRRSWVESANAPGADFPVQNLPFGVFRAQGGAARIGVAIGNGILDLGECALAGLLGGNSRVIDACKAARLNALMALPRSTVRELRARLASLLGVGSPETQRLRTLLVPMAEAEMLLPADIGDYTDFYASVHHATNLGRMFRPDNPLLPNYRYVPIAYHGRSSSMVPSGTPVRRPSGQIQDGDAAPVFAPSKALDYELEAGFFVGVGNEHGRPVPIDEAEQHIFGLCLVNDWSARDIQRWEYQPLGPFLGKNFATTVSPWVVTLDALAPFRVPAFTRPAGDPPPLPYLYAEHDQQAGGIDLTLAAFLSSAEMRRRGLPPVQLSCGNFQAVYWTIAQMLAHHTSNGCNLRPGDLLASGTVSGEAQNSWGSLIELTSRGSQPIALPGGEQRRFLAAGDEVIFRAWCERPGFARIGFGDCRGTILG